VLTFIFSRGWSPQLAVLKDIIPRDVSIMTIFELPYLANYYHPYSARRIGCGSKNLKRKRKVHLIVTETHFGDRVEAESLPSVESPRY